MNSYERYIATLKGEKTDFIPRIPIVMQFAAEYIGSNYGAFASDFNVLVEANEKTAKDFGFDQLSAISDPYRETQGFGGKITYLKDAVPRCSHPMEETKDFSVLKIPDPNNSERMLDRIKAIQKYKKVYNNEYSIMGWIEGPAAEAADIRGVINFLMDTLEDPLFVDDLMDKCVKTGIDFAKAQVKAGADTIGIGDAIASQISPDFYESAIQPKEKLLVDAIHEMGAFVRLHICGNIKHLLHDISGLGVDILDVDHMVDMENVRNIVGKHVVLCGNIDPVEGVLEGNPASIRHYMNHIYETVGNPFMISAGCEIPPGTPDDNLKALCRPIPFA